MSTFEQAIQKKILDIKIQMVQRKIKPTDGINKLKALNEILARYRKRANPLTEIKSA